MKCLSIAQPFADLVVSGKKRVELRRWNTGFRGEFLVHAPLRVRTDDARRLGMRGTPVTGAIIGSAEVTGVKEYTTESDLRRDRPLHFSAGRLAELGRGRSNGGRPRVCGLVMGNAKRFRVPVPFKGRLYFFEADLPEDSEYAPSDGAIRAEIMDEECRYQWINRH